MSTVADRFEMPGLGWLEWGLDVTHEDLYVWSSWTPVSDVVAFNLVWSIYVDRLEPIADMGVLALKLDDGLRSMLRIEGARMSRSPVMSYTLDGVRVESAWETRKDLVASEAMRRLEKMKSLMAAAPCG